MSTRDVNLEDIFNELAVGHALEKQALQDACQKLAPWMAAALDDPNVCSEMKADISKWFEALRGY